MKHFMRLQPAPFNCIKNGKKTIELRLFDAKRAKIKIGDIIEFTNLSNGEKLSVKVIKLHRFSSFEELFQNLPLEKCGYDEPDPQKYVDMNKYYTPEEQRLYGVLGIEFELT